MVLGLLLMWLLQSPPLQAGHASSGPNRYYTLEAVEPVLVAPVLELADPDGVVHRLADYRNRVVVINFWSTWCAPCRREMPSLEKAWQRLEPAGVVVLGVSIQDDPAMIRRFLQESRVSFPILLDRDGKVSQQWPFSGIPATFVLDRKGRIAYRAMGLREWDSEKIIRRITALTGDG